MSLVYSISKENLLNSHVLLLQYHFCLEHRHRYYHFTNYYSVYIFTFHLLKMPLSKVPICRNAVHCTTRHIQIIINKHACLSGKKNLHASLVTGDIYHDVTTVSRINWNEFFHFPFCLLWKEIHPNSVFT